jgi:hypothetical protein
MGMWKPGDTVVIVRNIARSDGTVTTAIPTILIQEDADLLVLFTPKGTTYKNNWVVPAEQKVASVEGIAPSAQRQYKDVVWQSNTLRLHLPGLRFCIGLTFDDNDQLALYYGNLEAPFVRTPIGVDSRDYALDVLAYPDGRWRWKDEDEFRRRGEVGLDSAAHQARVQAAGADLIERFGRKDFPFNAGWDKWQPPRDMQPPTLPEDWAADFGTHAVLTADHQ